jgi:CobQ-like glutamine amidotransferase family enzyme
MAAGLRIAHLYAEEMNIYGDRGNILTLMKRCQWRGIDVSVTAVGRGAQVAPDEFDLIFWGGGQDRDQALIFKDLVEKKADFIKQAAAAGTVVLAVCGGYQLLGDYYMAADGTRLPGIGLLDLHTVAGPRRNIGNVVVDVSRLGLDPPTLVGFENHSGRTYLGKELAPLGAVLQGFGNNGSDGTEGVCRANVFGTYLHGSLLPKNPHFADLLIRLALRQQVAVAPLDDTLELEAHREMVRRAGAVKRIAPKAA